MLGEVFGFIFLGESDLTSDQKMVVSSFFLWCLILSIMQVTTTNHCLGNVFFIFSKDLHGTTLKIAWGKTYRRTNNDILWVKYRWDFLKSKKPPFLNQRFTVRWMVRLTGLPMHLFLNPWMHHQVLILSLVWTPWAGKKKIWVFPKIVVPPNHPF